MGIFKNDNESAYVGGEKHWTDVIKNTGSGGVLLWKQPEEDFNTNSTLLVMPGEEAVFVKGGNIEQVFEKGTYKLSTENYPFISRLKNDFSGGISTFNCVVYFVRKAHTEEIKWGTDSPIKVRDKRLEIETIVKARGIYKIQIENPGIFIEKLVGSNVDVQAQTDLDKYFSLQFQSRIKATLTQALLEWPEELLGIESKLVEFSEIIRPHISNIVSEYGLICNQFVIAAMDIGDDALRRKYDEIGMATIERKRLAAAEKVARPLEGEGDEGAIEALGENWGRFQVANILGDLANNPGAGGIASAGAGLGMGMAAGGVFGNMAKEMFAPMSNSIQREHGTGTKPSNRFVQKNSGDFENANSPQSTQSDPVTILKQLKEMLDIGVISQEEFDQKKKEVMDRM